MKKKRGEATTTLFFLLGCFPHDYPRSALLNSMLNSGVQVDEDVAHLGMENSSMNRSSTS